MIGKRGFKVKKLKAFFNLFKIKIVYFCIVNYQKIHNQIIERARIRNLTDKKVSYFETHHIVPRCIGGSDDHSNLVNLTAREHFLIHWLLHRIYPNNYKLATAFWKCAYGNSKERKFVPSSRAYEEAKMSFVNISVVCEHCNKSYNYRNYVQFHGKNCRLNPNVDQQILLQRVKQRQEIKTKCEHCNVEVDYRNYTKWHGEMCKSNPNITVDIFEKKKLRKEKQSSSQTGRRTSRSKNIYIYDAKMNYLGCQRGLGDTSKFLNIPIITIFRILNDYNVRNKQYILSYQQLKAA